MKIPPAGTENQYYRLLFVHCYNFLLCYRNYFSDIFIFLCKQIIFMMNTIQIWQEYQPSCYLLDLLVKLLVFGSGKCSTNTRKVL